MGQLLFVASMPVDLLVFRVIIHFGEIELFVGAETGISIYGRALAIPAASAIATPEKRSVLIVFI